MTTNKTNKTGEANSRLWGARAADWADIQEGQCRAVYLAVFDRRFFPLPHLAPRAPSRYQMNLSFVLSLLMQGLIQLKYSTLTHHGNIQIWQPL